MHRISFVGVAQRCLYYKSHARPVCAATAVMVKSTSAGGYKDHTNNCDPLDGVFGDLDLDLKRKNDAFRRRQDENEEDRERMEEFYKKNPKSPFFFSLSQLHPVDALKVLTQKPFRQNKRIMDRLYAQYSKEYDSFKNEVETHNRMVFDYYKNQENIVAGKIAQFEAAVVSLKKKEQTLKNILSDM